MTTRMVPARIILHCSATPDGRVSDWGAIRRYHKQVNGWRDIGYHFGIELVGEDYEVLMGRWPDETGAHAVGQNYDSIGVCFVGAFDENRPPLGQWDAGIELVSWLCRHYGIPPARVYGHREFDSRKTCPGRAFDLERFRADLRKEMGL